jgi:hypothetical protein
MLALPESKFQEPQRGFPLVVPHWVKVKPLQVFAHWVPAQIAVALG